MKCENCGAETTTRFCPFCGSEMPYIGPNTVINNQQTIINNYYTEMPTSDSRNTSKKREYYSSKRKQIALLWCIFLGYLGAHYFYAGKIGKGILYVFTAGLFCFGWIIDIFRIISNDFKDKDGLRLDDSPMTQKEKCNVYLVLTIIGALGLIAGISSLEASITVFYLLWGSLFSFLYYRGKRKIDKEEEL